MICSTMAWKKADLVSTQGIGFVKEGLKSPIYNAIKNLPQITVHTSVIIRVQFFSTLMNWGNNSLIPDVRKTARI